MPDQHVGQSESGDDRNLSVRNAKRSCAQSSYQPERGESPDHAKGPESQRGKLGNSDFHNGPIDPPGNGNQDEEKPVSTGKCAHAATIAWRPVGAGWWHLRASLKICPKATRRATGWWCCHALSEKVTLVPVMTQSEVNINDLCGNLRHNPPEGGYWRKR